MTETITTYPIIWDAKITRGGDWRQTILLREDDGVTPKNTTGYSMTMTIMKSHPNGEVYDTLSTANGRIVNTTANGQFNIKLTAAEIDAYDFTTAVRRIVYDDGAGNTTPFAIGDVRVV